jgi:hypothetical protein
MDEMIDDDLLAIGLKAKDLTKQNPMDADIESLDDSSGLWDRIKFPALFLTLTVGIGVCEYLGLMAEIIAVPGMCVCAACFGGNLKK